ncbi:MAG: hypothetical protein IPH28_19785 [Cytophagaceae bacterium]|nr:hypothetical protein [Cytophagaceae bacterium]
MFFGSCKNNDPYDGLSSKIQKIVPEKILDSLESKGLIIHRGFAPPKLSLAIVSSPFKLLSPYGEDDSMEKGSVTGDYYYKFYDQNDQGDIKYSYYNIYQTDNGKGLGSFVF